MADRLPGRSIDDYIAQFPSETQLILAEIRAIIRDTAPAAIEKISYGMPTFDLNGTYLVYFAAWKNHIAIYPVTTGVAKVLEKEITRYMSGKGTLQFPLAQPVPTDLIRQIVSVRVQEVTG